MHLSLSRHELAERAFHVARNVLRRHVGKQDEYAAAFGGLNFIRFHPDGRTDVEPVNLAPNILAALQAKRTFIAREIDRHRDHLRRENATTGVDIEARREGIIGRDGEV